MSSLDASISVNHFSALRPSIWLLTLRKEPTPKARAVIFWLISWSRKLPPDPSVPGTSSTNAIDCSTITKLVSNAQDEDTGETRPQCVTVLTLTLMMKLVSGMMPCNIVFGTHFRSSNLCKCAFDPEIPLDCITTTAASTNAPRSPTRARRDLSRHQGRPPRTPSIVFPALHSHGDVQRAASSTTRGGAASVASKSKRPRSARGLLALAPRGLRAVLFVLVVLVAVAFTEAHRIASKRPRLRAEASASATRSAASSSSSAAAASRLLRSAQRARLKEASALLARRASPRNAPSDRQMGDRVRGNIPASTGSRKVPRTDSHDTRLRISFLYCTRGEDLADGVAAVASAPRRRTLAFTECNGGRWQNASYEELLEFADTQVALSLAVPTRDSALYTRLSPDNDEETPLYLRPCPTASQGRSLWRQAMHVWRDRSMYSVVIVVERTPPSHCAIASVDLIQLQKGAAAGRPMYETQLVLREINRTLEDDDQATAIDLCHRLLHRGPRF